MFCVFAVCSLLPAYLPLLVCLGTSHYFDMGYELALNGHPESGVEQSLRLRRADLRCLVRTSYSLVYKTAPPDGCDSDTEVTEWWAQRLIPGTIWHGMLQDIDTLGSEGSGGSDEPADALVYESLRSKLSSV